MKSKDNEVIQEAQETVAPEETAQVSKKRSKKPLIIVGIVVAVLIIAGVGLWVWHETPSFCGAICHDPMDPYYDTYSQEAGVAGIDKYGNEVSNTNAMLAVSHVAEGVTCLDCHTANLEQQIAEGKAWLAGDFESPLKERRLKDLTEATNTEADTFCLNENCHDMTRDDLYEIYAENEINFHNPVHSAQQCSACHKAHRASVVLCSQCHDSGYDMPEGWITVKEEKSLYLGK